MLRIEEGAVVSIDNENGKLNIHPDLVAVRHVHEGSRLLTSVAPFETPLL